LEDIVQSPKLNRIALVGLLSVAACATPYSPTPYSAIKESDFRSLKPGVTTKAEVKTLIGTPVMESHFSRTDQDVWEYSYLESRTIFMLAYVHFDKNGKYTHYDQLPDPAFTSGTCM
jgi:outer membrane protein assembly factor BamE (lipoprotein component of BamABCDE complex)